MQVIKQESVFLTKNFIREFLAGKNAKDLNSTANYQWKVKPGLRGLLVSLITGIQPGVVLIEHIIYEQNCR